MSATVKWTLGIILAILACSIVLAVWFSKTAPKPIVENLPPNVKSIFFDAEWFEVLWKRWTVADWILGLLAAGTAVTAAVKNAFSSHNTENANGDTTVSTQFDRAVMLFAALSVAATTLDGKMRPAQMAERYRQGDLLMQEAIMDYRQSHDEKALLATWHQAQRILEGAPAVPPKNATVNEPAQTPQSSTPAEK